MKKIFNSKLLFSAIVFSSLFISCNEDDNSTTDLRYVKSIVTADATTFNLDEGQTATVTLTVNNPIKDDMDYKLELVGGSGSFRDFTCSGSETTVGDGAGIIGHMLHFPAYATTFSFDISAELDYLPEGTEQLVFRLYGMSNSLGLVDAASETITVNIAPVTLNEIQMNLTWATYVNAHGNIVDLEYNDVDDESHAYADFDFDLGFYNNTGFTAGHPEYEGMDEFASDGDYDVDVDLWDTTTATAPAKVINFSPMLTISKPGVWVHTIDLSNMWTSDDLGSWFGDDEYTTVASINKTGTVFTLTDMTSAVLATGRQANSVKKTNPKRK